MDTVMLSIGIDLGQRRDFTAITVLEIIETGSNRRGTQYAFEARHLERLPLGTSYPDVADRLATVQANAELAGRQAFLERKGRAPSMVVLRTWMDATGAVPALDLFRERGIDVVPCFFTHGDRRTEQHGQVTIGKAWLVNRLQALAQNDRLHLPPRHPQAAAMLRELQDYEIKVDQNANDRYGAFTVGSHDDLVTSVGLAAQWAPPPHTAAMDGAIAEFLSNLG